MMTLLLIFVPYWIFVGMSPLLYMKDLGVSLAHFGFYQGVLALSFAIGSILFGLIIKNSPCEQKTLLKVSITILIVSLIILTMITMVNSRNALIITLGFLPFIIGQIIPSTILYPVCLNLIPHSKGRVSAIIQGARLILTSIAVQIAGYFYAGSFQNIGIILVAFILAGIIALIQVYHNRNIV
jgi:DHA1 family bicyclomycin/chloramphenicol resistance-like MFS transporter